MGPKITSDRSGSPNDRPRALRWVFRCPCANGSADRCRWALRVAVSVAIVGGALAGAADFASAASSCITDGPSSGAYTVSLCLQQPTAGQTLIGVASVSAAVTVTGSSPGKVAQVIFYLDGQYVLTDTESPYGFNLPTTRWVDGSHLLEVEVLMTDTFWTRRAGVGLVFSNGVTQPPVNTKTFTPATGTPPPSGQPFVVATVGDAAGGKAASAGVSDLISSWNPNLFLYLGDVYQEGTPTEFYNYYGDSYRLFGRLRSITDPTLGDHEYETSGAAGYFDYWDNAPKTYSFNAGGWHFATFDSTEYDLSTTSPEYRWLQQDLAANSLPCTLVFFHDPEFDVGQYTPSVQSSQLKDIWALLATDGVDVALNGQTHNYQRWQPLDGTGTVSPNGVTEFVVGTGGHTLVGFGPTDSRLAKGLTGSPGGIGALSLQLNPYGGSFRYVSTGGATLDSGPLSCSGVPPDSSPPTAPAGLTATAGPNGTSRVDLAWSPATDDRGVTAYDIYRNDAQIASVGNVTSYQDAAVSPLTSYRYTVRARDGGGNVSQMSDAVATATPATLFQDDFETGDLSQWTAVSGLTVQQQAVFRGTFGARMTTPASEGTYALRSLSPDQLGLYYRVRFDLFSQSQLVSLLKFKKPGSGGSILGVYVSSTGKLGTWNYATNVGTTSSTVVSKGAWHEVQAHLLVNGTSSQVEVWLDGARIDALSTAQSLGTTATGRVQLGENSTTGGYDVALDDAVVATSFISTAPSVKDQAIATDEDMAIPISLPAGSAEGNCPLSFSILLRPQHGELSVPANVRCSGGGAAADVSYAPSPDYNGPDTFSYQVVDSKGVASPAATVALTIRPVDDPPTAGPVNLATDEDTSSPWYPVPSDVESGSLTCSIASPPSHGSATVAADCSAGTYAPSADYNGTDGFTYRVTDSEGASSASGSVAVTVDPVNDPPSAAPVALTVYQNSVGRWMPSVSDVDGDALTCAVTVPPTHGSATVTADCSGGTYTPAPGYAGSDSFAYRASDPSGSLSPAESVSATVVSPIIFTDGFESGSLSSWSSSGGLQVQGATVHGGAFAAEANTTKANTWARKTLVTTYTEVYFRTYFRVDSQKKTFTLLGMAGPDGKEIAAAYLSSDQRLGLRNDVGGKSITSATKVSFKTWYALTLHVLVNGSSSTTEVFLGGVSVPELSASNTNLGTSPVGELRLGELTTAGGTSYHLYLDDALASTNRI